MKKLSQKNKGFSLVELLVVVSIFVIITGVVLFNQNKFSSDISITNVSYAIALQIRQAQVYGTLVRSPNFTEYDLSYGVHFFKEANNLSTFYFFADNNRNNKFDDPSVDNLISSHMLGEGNTISSICTYQTIGNNERCMGDSESTNDLSSVDIMFKRPDPSAKIFDSLTGTNTPLQEAKIFVKSSLRDKERIIRVLGTGQISVLPN